MIDFRWLCENRANIIEESSWRQAGKAGKRSQHAQTGIPEVRLCFENFR